MVLTKKEEDLTKADIVLKFAQDKMHKHHVLVDEEIKVSHEPLTATILATHKDAAALLQKAVADAKIALESQFE